ncbi:hypothetical protein [Methylobacterium hispanicum]|uniref:hypothetical protein n=1 Tax=Methylobacterium hispanicum TaxID=270350 RepID=UPI002F3559FF
MLEVALRSRQRSVGLRELERALPRLIEGRTLRLSTKKDVKVKFRSRLFVACDGTNRGSRSFFQISLEAHSMRAVKMSFAFFGLMIAPLAAQTAVSPQHSRAQSPNMPQAHETVPERVHPQTPVATETVNENAQARDAAKQPN